MALSQRVNKSERQQNKSKMKSVRSKTKLEKRADASRRAWRTRKRMQAARAPTIEKLTLGVDDVLVLRSDEPITAEAAMRLKDQMQEIFPGRKIVVLGDGLRLGAVTLQKYETSLPALDYGASH